VDDQLTELRRLAPTIDAAASRALFDRRRRSRRKRRRAGTLAASVMLLAGGSVGVWRVTADGDDPTVVVQAGPPSSTATSATAAPEPSSVTPTSVVVADDGGSTAGPLSSGSWHDIANGPLSFRTLVASTWTGRELLVWGGVDGTTFFDDGAAYDPATDTWRTLAPAPSGGRSQAHSAWTGREWLIIGGASEASAGLDSGGLAYDPAADTWRALAVAPLVPAAVAWSGQELLAVDEGGATVVGYTPETDSWRTVAVFPPVERDSGQASIATDGTTATVFRTWTRPLGAGSSAGLEVDTIDIATGHVEVAPAVDQAPIGIVRPVSTGDGIVALATSNCAPGWSCPAQQPAGPMPAAYDPVSNEWRLAGIPPHASSGFPVWTGSLVVVAGSFTATENGERLPALAWDPTTGAWTDLPAPPASGFLVAEWAGDQLLTWGEVGPEGSSTRGHAFQPAS
jgi:hypothetical protein